MHAVALGVLAFVAGHSPETQGRAGTPLRVFLVRGEAPPGDDAHEAPRPQAAPARSPIRAEPAARPARTPIAHVKAAPPAAAARPSRPAKPTPTSEPTSETPTDTAAAPSGASKSQAGRTPLGGDGHPRDAWRGPDQVTRVARPLAPIRPAYPASARLRGEESTVVVEAWIDEGGGVAFAAILRSGGPDFDSSAERAVRRAAFRPAEWDGRNVPSRVALRVHFDLYD